MERGDKVLVLDDLSTGSIDNIEHLKRQFRDQLDKLLEEYD